MNCPKCKSDQVYCIDSRQIKVERRRKYECVRCKTRFRTVETVIEINEKGDENTMKTTNGKGVPKPGEKFEYNGQKFIALGLEQGGLLAIAEKPIGDMPFDEDGRADWRTASLRSYLNGDYLKKLGEGDLMPFTSDLTADDGMKDYGTTEDYVFLLSDALYRKYRDVIPRFRTWWWTITPWSCLPSYASNERNVYTSGALSNRDATVTYGVVPSLLFNLQSFE